MSAPGRCSPAALGAVGAVALLVIAGCGTGPGGDPAADAAADPAARLAELAEEAWQRQLEQSPFFQLREGLLVTELVDLTPQQAAEDVAWARDLRRRLDELPREELSADDRVTLDLLLWDTEMAIEAEPFYWLRFPVTPYLAGFRLGFVHQVFAGYPLSDPDLHPAGYLGLLAEYAASIRQLDAHLRGQIERGLYLPKAALPGVVSLFASFEAGLGELLGVAPDRLGGLGDEGPIFQAAVARSIETEVAPAYRALLATLRDPAYEAAAPRSVGLSQYPGGEAYYRHLVRLHTTLDVTPEELHELGKRRVAEISSEMAAIRDELGFVGSQADFHARLRADPRFLASTPAEVEERFLDYIARIEPLVPTLFDETPRAPYGVRRLDPAAEGSMTFGYYQPPTPGEERGLYLYNGSRLDERSLVFAGPLIYHELVPGHHFHLALQEENEALPAYRRNYLGGTAFNEGWGNYGALLAREHGLLEDPYDRYGWAIFDMFISARLVLDTGMNLLGWSLEEGRETMRRHTFQSETEIATETLRYSTDMPGQALAYKAGLEKLLELRRRARELSGGELDLRRFHRVVLDQGGLPLGVLERRVEEEFGAGSSSG